MCYVCGKSSNKIIHVQNCGYVKQIPQKNKKFFNDPKEAVESGYSFCKHCSYLNRYVRRERNSIENYCKANGLFMEFNRKDGSLDIISHTGKWKIIVNGQRHFIWLYHKNLSGMNNSSMVPGYHSQKVRKSTILGYLEYIVEHDTYREEDPLYSYQKKTGKKNRKSRARKTELIKTWQSIRYVTSILNGMSEGRIAY